jgi:hypothetical protein
MSGELAVAAFLGFCVGYMTAQRKKRWIRK